MRHNPAGLSLTQQALDCHRRLPDGDVNLRPARLMWTGTITPTPMSREYRVQVTYTKGLYPKVRVLDELEGRAGESLPHVYNDGTLCLHLPGEWRSAMFLADSTITWTAEWLFNYEVWKATGEWYGGGQWPPSRPIDEPGARTGIRGRIPPISSHLGEDRRHRGARRA
jgi:hypothetical protein